MFGFDRERVTMNRRRYLVVMSGGVVGSLAGCVGARDPTSNTESPTHAGATPDSASVTGADGSPAGICQRDPRPGLIPAIVEPAFAPDWDDLSGDSSLDDSTPVVGIDRAGEARAYPISVLSYEIVNDSFEVPVLVTYCPLCSSGLTAVRRVNGQETVFGNTGYTWRPPGVAGQAAIESGRVFGLSHRDRPDQTRPTNDPNLVMFDRATGSFWSQLLAQAICGPSTGATLTLVPSTVTDWGTWRRDHPETTVLLPPPHSTTMGG